MKILSNHTNIDKPINYGTANGRIWLEREYLPKVKGRTFFIGVDYYTNFYHRLVKDPKLFETLDIQDNLSNNGSPYKHYVCNLLDFKNDKYKYDNIICFGLFGHKDSAWEIITQKDEIIKCLNVIDENLKPGGRLLFAPGTQTLNDEFWREIFLSVFGNLYHFEKVHKIDINIILEATKK